MRRIYAVIEVAETSRFDPDSDAELDDLAEDLLTIVHGVTSAAVYTSAEDLVAEESGP